MRFRKLLSGPFLLCFSLIFLTSCVSRKKMAYFQNIDQLEKSSGRSITNNLEIQPDDMLTIRVSAPEQEAALPFNLTKTVGSQIVAGSNVELETYLVSDKGEIIFPIIGVIEVEGLTTIELAAKIKSLITEYVQDPIVNVRILNFKISVLGEVNQPGTFKIEDDHINLSQALALAGDLTIYGKRDNILIIGSKNGVETYTHLDLTAADVTDSPYYNLRQNDVIYVEPRASRRQSAGSAGITATFLSIISVAASLVVLITK